MIGATTMTHPLPRYANVAPKIHGERERKTSACEQKFNPSTCERERKTSACEQKFNPPACERERKTSACEQKLNLSACQSETVPSVCDSGSTPSVSGSCKCNNCHDSESCSSCSIANGGYLRAAPEVRPPVPCRQRRFTDDFSPEKYFNESNIIQHDTKRLKALDIPLPLPSDLNNDSVFLNEPFPNRHGPQIGPPPLPIQPHVTSSHKRFREPLPTPAPPAQRGLSSSQFYRKPSDELPVPNRSLSTQPLIHDHSIEVTGKPNLEHKLDDLSHLTVTLPKKKSDHKKLNRQKHEPSKNNILIKIGTIISSVLLIGLMYMVAKSVREMFFVSRHHISRPQHLWNYSEPADSKLDTTICFSCETMKEFERHQSRFDLYGFKSGDKTRHCCVDQLGHLKWLVSMMKTNEILKQKEASKNSTSKSSCSVKVTMVQITNDGKTSLTLNNTRMKTFCKGAPINVTKNSLMVKKEGMYMLYMTMSVVLNPDKVNEATGHKVLKAYISCSKSKKGKCIEVETLNKTQPLVDTQYHVFNIYTVKQFTSGERFYPVLSEPKYIYPSELGNFIGVVEL
ncbi:uncharacterized protein [Argopecten irradians]|uniref:uncharacterized protein n=1 Tax=Argopecten irradians TaxID=31199 RepID=UPI00371DF976